MASWSQCEIVTGVSIMHQLRILRSVPYMAWCGDRGSGQCRIRGMAVRYGNGMANNGVFCITEKTHFFLV